MVIFWLSAHSANDVCHFSNDWSSIFYGLKPCGTLRFCLSVDESSLILQGMDAPITQTVNFHLFNYFTKYHTCLIFLDAWKSVFWNSETSTAVNPIFSNESWTWDCNLLLIAFGGSCFFVFSVKEKFIKILNAFGLSDVIVFILTKILLSLDCFWGFFCRENYIFQLIIRFQVWD